MPPFCRFSRVFLVFPGKPSLLGGKERFVTVSFFTLGCKVNQYETQYLANVLHKKAIKLWRERLHRCWSSIPVPSLPCPTKKARQLLHRLRRKNPDSILVLCGCFPQAFPDQAAALDADVITGNTNRTEIPDLVEQARQNKVIKHRPHPLGELFEPMQVQGLARHTRAFFKNPGWLRPVLHLLHYPHSPRPQPLQTSGRVSPGSQLLADQGYREIVLTGIDLTSYGRELGVDPL